MRDLFIGACFVIIGYFLFCCVMEIRDIRKDMNSLEYTDVYMEVIR